MQSLVLDWETYWAKDYTLSKMTTESYIRDPRFRVHGVGLKIGNLPSRWITADRVKDVLAAIPWDDVAMIGHFLQFDASILDWHYGYRPKLYIDTVGMSRALVGQDMAKHGLEHTAMRQIGMTKIPGYLAETMGVYKLPPDMEKRLAEYCVGMPRYSIPRNRWEAGDTELTYGIARNMLPHFPKKELRILDWSIRRFTESPLWLDEEVLSDYLLEVQEGKARALQRAGLDTRETLMSNNKYAEALKALGVRPPTKVNAKGQVKFAFAKTDADHKALLDHDDPDVQAIVAARLAVKTTIEETRAQAYLEAAPRGNWPVAYSYSGAKNTQRMSGNKGGGGNPMNLKRGGRLRDAIYVGDGKVQLVLDLSQIECRIALWLGALSRQSNGAERQALDRLAKGDYYKLRGDKDEADKYDLYRFFASMMFGCDISQVDKNMRQIAKSAVLGLGFGMGAGRYMDYALAMGAKGVDAQLAEATVALYRNTYKGVKAMWRTFEQAFKNVVNARTEALARATLEGMSDADTLARIITVTNEQGWEIGPFKIQAEPLFGHVAMGTPGDLLVKYPDLAWDAEGEGTYRDGNSRVKIFGGKFYENGIQYAARNILMDMMLKINPRYECAMSTYDELVCIVDDEPAAIEEAVNFCVGVMTTEHPNFPGLPLGVEWGHHQVYGKAKH